MMLSRKLEVAVTVVLLMIGAAARAQGSERLSVSVVGDNYVLAVPVSRVELLVPKGNLVQIPARVGGSTESPRYFQLGDLSQGLIISGWFESSSGYSGMDRYWEQQLAAWKNRNLPTPSDVSMQKIGNWDAVFYELPVLTGSSSHVRAHLVQSGTWIDVHVSVSAESSTVSNRTRVEGFLRSLVVRERPHG
jgi:hypothetical protein